MGQHERVILWNDVGIGVQWPHDGEPLLAPKDQRGSLLINAEVFP